MKGVSMKAIKSGDRLIDRFTSAKYILILLHTCDLKVVFILKKDKFLLC